MTIYPNHFETSVGVDAAPAELFAQIDDPSELAAHMTSSSMMMAGSSMVYSFDEGRGKALGSKIVMKGSMLGLKLWLEEVVTQREAPFRKAWETIGDPRLLVIGGYRMGFEIATQGNGSRLKVFIDWRDSPFPWRWLSWLLGSAYAKWCARSMAEGAAESFKGLGTTVEKHAT